MAAGQKSRSPSQYNNATHGRRESNGPPGDLTINTALTRVSLTRGQWKEGPMVVRPYPAADYTNPAVPVPGRLNTLGHGQSHWIIRTSVAKAIGMPDGERFTFNLYEPWLVDNDRSLRDRNPYVVFYKQCTAAFKAGEFGPGLGWNPLHNKLMPSVGGGSKDFAAISKPNALGFFQGNIYVNGAMDYVCGKGKDGSPFGAHDTDPLPVIQIAGQAFEKILDIFDTEKDNPGDYDEVAQPWKKYLYEDATGIYDAKTGTIKGGWFLVIFNPSKAKYLEGDPKTGPLIKIGGQTIKASRSSWNGEIANTQGYEVAILKNYVAENGDKYTADMDAAAVIRANKQFQFWEDDEASKQKGLLRFPAVEEQCELVARAFADVPSLVRAAWADFDEFMTPEVEKILAASVSAVMPGTAEEQASAKKAGKTTRTAQTDVTARGHGKKDEIDDDSIDSELQDAVLPNEEEVDPTAADDANNGAEDDEIIEAAAEEVPADDLVDEEIATEEMASSDEFVEEPSTEDAELEEELKEEASADAGSDAETSIDDEVVENDEPAPVPQGRRKAAVAKKPKDDEYFQDEQANEEAPAPAPVKAGRKSGKNAAVVSAAAESEPVQLEIPFEEDAGEPETVVASREETLNASLAAAKKVVSAAAAALARAKQRVGPVANVVAKPVIKSPAAKPAVTPVVGANKSAVVAKPGVKPAATAVKPAGKALPPTSALRTAAK